MQLSSLLDGVVDTSASLAITGVELDSRNVNPGDLFLAVRGQEADGREYVRQAAERGAAAALVEDEVIDTSVSLPQFPVPQLRLLVSELAGRFYSHPSQSMGVVAVTGTNGKTTFVSLLAQLLRAAGHKCGVIGTLGTSLDGSVSDATNTTPDAVTLQRTIASWQREGVRFLAMEASSHALDQGRLAAVDIDVAVFTNLTRDHLDYHGDMRRYASAKTSLFEFESLRAAILNADDPHVSLFEEIIGPEVQCLAYGRHARNLDIRVSELVSSSDGLCFSLSSPWGDAEICCPLLGEFNAMNLTAALAAGMQAGQPLDVLTEAAQALTPASGRMEPLRAAGAPLVVIDYAHTPDALMQVLAALREQCDGELIAVFGCGGDRDRGKRALMGEAVSRLATRAIITSDNPRNEDPWNIIGDIETGMSCPYEIVEDRGAAIEKAIRDASVDACVLIAGKGHEHYQIVGTERRFFSDHESANQVLAGFAA